MKEHDEEREIYGAIYVQDRKYFLLEPRPTRRDLWQVEGTSKWLVADEDSFSVVRVPSVKVGQAGDYVYLGEASYVVIGSDALIEIFPNPHKKVIRFYVTDDEEA